MMYVHTVGLLACCILLADNVTGIPKGCGL